MLGNRNGVFTDSRGKYSECHEYAGESTVHFDVDDSGKDIAAATDLETEPLKSGVYLPVTLSGEIDEDSAYGGLPVEAVLARDVKIKKGVTLARGAMLKGAVTRFQIFHEPAHAVLLRIEFHSIIDGKKLYLCNAIHEVHHTFFSSPALGGRTGRPLPPVQTSADDETANGSMRFNTEHLHLDRNFSSTFITVDHTETALP